MPYNQNDIGYQKNEASRNAASFNSEGKLTLREQVFILFKKHKELTNEDVSFHLNKPEISVQPRISELKNDGRVHNSGKKSMGKWGTLITIWAIST